MSFAEILLRLGSALVAWMVIYAYFLWTVILRQVDCSEELYKLLLGMAPITVGLAVLLRNTRPLDDVHRILRWLSVPLLLLIPPVALSIWSVLSRVNIQGMGICSAERGAEWHPWWAPVQVVAIAFSILMLLRVWRSSPAYGPLQVDEDS